MKHCGLIMPFSCILVIGVLDAIARDQEQPLSSLLLLQTAWSNPHSHSNGLALAAEMMSCISLDFCMENNVLVTFGRPEDLIWTAVCG